jgi:hypothetical protein
MEQSRAAEDGQTSTLAVGHSVDNFSAFKTTILFLMLQPGSRDSSVGIAMGLGRAVAQAVSSGLPPRRSGFASGQGMWGLWWTTRQWGSFSPSTSVSLANHHSINFSIIIITRGWHNRPIGGRSPEWNLFDSTPHYTN